MTQVRDGAQATRLPLLIATPPVTSKFHSLRTAAVFLRIVGSIMIVPAILAGLYVMIPLYLSVVMGSKPDGGQMLIPLIVAFGSGVLALPYFAAAAMIDLALAIEENTRNIPERIVAALNNAITANEERRAAR